MTKEQYLRMMGWIRSKKYGISLIKWSGKGITYLTAFVYVAELLVLGYGRDRRLAPCLIVPAASFVFVSFFRAWYGKERPYEKYGFEPLLPKNTKAKSFPSRHVFSIFVIAAVTCFVWPFAGGMLLLCGTVLAALRVMMGVHFPSDVLAGAVLGIAGGLIGMGVWMLEYIR